MNEGMTMKAARLHEAGGRFVVDDIPVPSVRPTDVLVKVAATGMVHNLRNVISVYYTSKPYLTLPKLPAVFGLDATGVVEKIGSEVRSGIAIGDRVYVNPGLSCGACDACRRLNPTHCPDFAFQGYFGFGLNSQHRYDAYPYGGFSEFLTCPVGNLVKLPDAVSFEQAARFGYLGTAYAAFKKAKFQPGQSVLINGATGTLGVGAVTLALAMGACQVLVTGRDMPRLDRLKALAPRRITAVPFSQGPIASRVRAATEGAGVHVVIDALAPETSSAVMLDGYEALRNGGVLVNVGGINDPISFAPNRMMHRQTGMLGSNWFTTADGQEMADMAASGLLNLDVYEHQCYSLSEINDGIEAMQVRNGGFTNFVVKP